MEDAQFCLPLLSVIKEPETLVVEPNVVKVLEDWLVDARAGRITAIAIAAITFDGKAQTNFGGYQQIGLLGSVSLLKDRMIAHLRGRP